MRKQSAEVIAEVNRSRAGVALGKARVEYQIAKREALAQFKADTAPINAEHRKIHAAARDKYAKSVKAMTDVYNEVRHIDIWMVEP